MDTGAMLEQAHCGESLPGSGSGHLGTGAEAGTTDGGTHSRQPAPQEVGGWVASTLFHQDHLRCQGLRSPRQGQRVGPSAPMGTRDRGPGMNRATVATSR